MSNHFISDRRTLAFAASTTLRVGRPRSSTSSRSVPLCALADPRELASGAEKIASIDELAVHVWRRLFGGGPPGGSNSSAARPASAVSSPVSSFGTSDGLWRYILSTTVTTKPGSEVRMAKLLGTLDAAADKCGVLTRAVNQDPDALNTFLVLERFASQDEMTKYQRSEEYQAFIRDSQPLLEKPLGVYLCKEQDGKITSGFYPFGPAGEGGRDDMVYR